MKKRLTLLLVLTMAVVPFLGSQSVGIEEAGTATSVNAQDTTLLIWADETRAPVIEEIAPDFLDEYGVEIEIQQIGFGDIRDQFIIAGPAGEGPDLFIGAHDWIGELVASGLISPVDLTEVEDEFSAAALQGFTYEGEVYGLPYAVENVAFFTNPDLVEEAPETWDDVRAISETLAEEGAAEWGYAIQENDPYHFFPIQTAFGGYVFAYEEGVGYDPSDLGIDSEGTVAAFNWLDGMVEDGLTPDGLDYDAMHALFENSEAAMMISGPWALERINESGVNYQVNVIPAGPAGPARPFLGVQGFYVSAFSENQQLAQIFLTEFVATEDVMRAFYETNDRPPAYLSVLEEIEDEDLLAFGQAGINGLTMPAIPEMNAVWTAWGDAMQLIIQQQEEPEDALDNAAEQIRNALTEEDEEE